MKLTKSEILEIWNAINDIKVKPNPKFGYAIARNREAIKNVVQALSEAQQFGKDNEDWQEYQKKYTEIINKYSNDGKTIPQHQIADFSKETNKLDKEFEVILKDFKQHSKEFESMLKDKEEVKFHKVKLENVPEDLEQRHYNILHIMFDE